MAFVDEGKDIELAKYIRALIGQRLVDQKAELSNVALVDQNW